MIQVEKFDEEIRGGGGGPGNYFFGREGGGGGFFWGRNGAGKSTTMRMLTGYLPLDRWPDRSGWGEIA